MVADIAAAFVLLVAGGCARMISAGVWALYVQFIHDSVEQDLAIAATKPEAKVKKALARMTTTMQKEYTGTKHAGKVPMWTAGLDRETVEEVLRKEREAREEVRKAKEELLGDDDEVWMKIAMQSGASRSEAEKRVKRFHAMRKNSPRLKEDVDEGFFDEEPDYVY